MARSAILLALGVALINMFLLSSDAILAAPEDPWDSYVDVDPTQAEAAVREIAKYTPLLTDVDPQAVSVALTATDASDFLPRPDQALRDTEATDLERTYVVEKGDTITTIATKFGLHVASIVDRNQLSLDGLESLHPGESLIIPSHDTSDSTEWLTALNDKKAAERARADAQRQRRLARSAVAGARSARAATTRERSSTGFDGDGGAAGLIVPINHNGITRGVGRGHDGIDYRSDVGTPVRAAADGRVIEITGGWGSGFGNSVLVDHGGGLTTRYAHLSSPTVGVGDTVTQGEQVGRSGNTGFSTGPHLHFEARRSGRVVRPF